MQRFVILRKARGGYASPTHVNIGLLLWQLLYVRLEQK